MVENQAGVTALVTAYARAYHSTHDSPGVFNDFLADELFTAQEHIELDRNMAHILTLFDPSLAAAQADQDAALAIAMQTIYEPVTLSRSRFCEDCLENAVHQGIDQYVILGAGFDTFAFRRPDLLKNLQVFELDHPVTQAMKRDRIVRAGWQIPAGLTMAPIDFNSQNLSDILPAAGYDVRRLAFFGWLGVTYYLSREAVLSTLRELRSLAAAGSQIVFDYIDTEAFKPGKGSRHSKVMSGIVRQAGEPMKSAFAPKTLARELEYCGWGLVENLDPGEIQRRFFSGRNDRLKADDHTYLARAVSH